MASSRTMARFAREDRGAVTIEFVVMLPIFVAALAFAYEFGQLFLTYQSTASNVRSAARYLARVDEPQDHRDAARNIIRTGGLDDDADAFPYLRNACPRLRDCFTITSSTVTVSVQVNYPLTLFGFVGGEAGASLPIRIVETSSRTGV